MAVLSLIVQRNRYARAYGALCFGNVRDLLIVLAMCAVKGSALKSCAL